MMICCVAPKHRGHVRRAFAQFVNKSALFILELILSSVHIVSNMLDFHHDVECVDNLLNLLLTGQL